jgi:hypothetical protein
VVLRNANVAFKYARAEVVGHASHTTAVVFAGSSGRGAGGVMCADSVRCEDALFVCVSDAVAVSSRAAAGPSRSAGCATQR